MKTLMVVVMVLLMAGVAAAEKFQVETVPLTILGQPACMVRTVRAGGPLNGLLGNTAQSQVTYGLAADGKTLTCLSNSQSNSDGLGKAMLQGVPQAAMLGGMQIIAAGAIRPDQTTTTVNVPVSGGVGNVKQAQGQVGINAQQQGQIQNQSQAQAQANSNHNVSNNHNSDGWIPPGHDK